MSIKYEGIEFSTVQELLEYQKAKEKEKVSEKEMLDLAEKYDQQQPPQPLTKILFHRTSKWGVWTKEEDDAIIGFCLEDKNLSPTGKLRKGRTERLAKRIRRPTLATKSRITHLRVLGKLKFHQNYSDALKKVHTMRRKKALVPNGFVEERLALTNKATSTPQISTKDLEFPEIYPIAHDSLPILESIIKYGLANKSKLSMFDFSTTIALVNDLEWCGLVWRDFCNELIKKRPLIAKAMNFDPLRIKVVFEGKYHFIKFE